MRYSQAATFVQVQMPSQESVDNHQMVGLFMASDRTGANQHLGVRLSDKYGADTTIIRPMPITDEVGRPPLSDDHGVYRELSGARLIGVDFPGMGDGTGPITRIQKDSLKLGTFTEVADAQWEAIGLALDRQGLNYSDLGRVVLWGTSLGGAEIAGLYATKPEDVKVTDLVFQITPWRTALNGLIRGFAAAGQDRQYYYQLDGQNYNGRESDAQWLRRISTRRKLGAAGLAARALGQGQIMTDLERRPLGGIRVSVFNAEHDRISPTGDNQAAVQALREMKASVEYHLMSGEYHAIQQSRRVVGRQQQDVVESY